ncbi:MAG: L,D-transpeptidase family protein [Pyrinomonadaceae bacterium]|nr:L,D-transpeptidase family protein [Pyrinomonadaceae bacterium]
MKQDSKLTMIVLGLALILFGAACVTQPTSNSNSEPGAIPSPSSSPTSTASPTVSAAPVTLPVLDAFFGSDETFTAELKTKLSLTDDQITQLRKVAREETAKLRETEAGDHTGTTAAARELAANRVKEIVGAEKEAQLAAFVSERWRVGTDAPDTKNATPPTESLSSTPNAVPTDTRVVVNAPAYRMDVFEGGRLVKSYKVGIGYPEFPLPTGLRSAKAIIFNPTWTPPDEPWVESPSSKVKVGEKVEAGSKLNPLGLLKIPIGSPSLIHGGKSAAKLGTFASHGCVGLTDALAQDFAKVLAQLAGKKLSDADIAGYKKNRSETRQFTLSEPVLVELRYETIVAEDGKLHIYRDVYDRNTNTEETLRAVLDASGVKLEDLTEEERSQVLGALEEMSRDAKGKPDTLATAKTSASPSASPASSPKAIAKTSGKVTRNFKGKKEVVIEIAALKGKGYPAMAVSAGATPKAKT